MTADSDLAGLQVHDAKITADYLSGMAKIATGDPECAVTSWQIAAVHGGFGGAIGGTALFRFSLTTAAEGAVSLILKILRRRPDESVQSPYYWKREFEIYRAGLLNDLPNCGFGPPRVYCLEDHGDACWIWMEDIAEARLDWSLHDYADIAERLGRFNGAWLRRSDLPRAAWLANDWHSAIVPALADTFSQLDKLLENPLAQATLPLDAMDEIMAIWRDRELFRRALAELPRTFCHFDAFRRNFLLNQVDVFLIDWALAGIGGPGEDLVSLVAVSLYYDGFTRDYASELDEHVFAGYVQGLREAGWHGDTRLARIGYTCGMTLRGLAGVKQDINLLVDGSKHEQLRQNHDMNSLEDIARFFAEIRRFRLLVMSREARSLLAG